MSVSYLSVIDEERFGIRTARVSSVTAESLPSVLEFCRTKDIVFLIARCATSDLNAAQAMEQEGFLLMDTLVYYARDLRKGPLPQDAGKVSVRAIRPGEEDAVRRVARESFRGYFGHYHADSRLDRAACDEVYTSWASRSCLSREVADEVLVADRGDKIVGFLTLKVNTAEEGEGRLFAVAPEVQSQEISSSLMVQAMEWFLSRSVRRMIISTQITNIAAQKAWVRLGFEPAYAYYTFHKWFNQS